MEQQITNYLTSLNANDIKTILTFVGAGAGVSIFLQAIKHKWSLFAETHTKWIVGLLAVLSYAVAAANYLVSHSTQNPAILLPHATEIMTAAIAVYHVSVSPLYKKLVVILTEAATYRTITAPQKTTPQVVATTPSEFPD